MESEKKVASVGSVFRLFWQETVRQPFLFSLVIVGVLGAQASSLSIPWLLRELLNTLITHDPNMATSRVLLGVIGLISLAMFLRWAFYRLQFFSISFLELRVMAHLTASSFEYLMRHSYAFFSNQFAGTLTRRVAKYGQAFEAVFDAIVSSFFPTAIFIIGAIAVLFIHNATLGLVLGVWSVCFIIVQIFFARAHEPLRVEESHHDSALSGAIADAISNQSAATFFAGFRHEHGRLNEYVGRWRMAQLRAWKFSEMVWGVQGLSTLIANVALLYGAVYYWQRGELTIGDFVLIQTYLIGAVEMLNGLSREVRRFNSAFTDAGEMVAILEQPHDIQDIPNAPSLTVSSGMIEFQKVGFSFNQDRPVLADFNLTIRAGEKVALVGPSGAGKSTITKLLLRLYDVTDGAIEIDGQNISQVTQDSLRESISFVPQEPILFHRSLMENIRYGRRDATDEEVIEAARKAHCHEFIDALPDKYETFVGERGVKLSGGERQRVAIARAILKDAPILVLDEATSSLDSESEALIQDSLKVLMQGKTVVAIAHRLSTIMTMDRIIVVEGGTIVDAGTHEELLKNDGLYQKLWSIQAGGFIVDEEE